MWRSIGITRWRGASPSWLDAMCVCASPWKDSSPTRSGSSCNGSRVSIHPRTWSRRCSRETDGNPFFIRELVSLLAERHAESRPVDAASRELEVPAGVREVIRGRLRRLSPACTEALEIASVVGREFAMEILEAASELGRESLAEALDEAQRAGLIDESSEAGATASPTRSPRRPSTSSRAPTAGRSSTGGSARRWSGSTRRIRIPISRISRATSARRGMGRRRWSYATRAGHRAMDQLAWRRRRRCTRALFAPWTGAAERSPRSVVISAGPGAGIASERAISTLAAASWKGPSRRSQHGSANASPGATALRPVPVLPGSRTSKPPSCSKEALKAPGPERDRPGARAALEPPRRQALV